MILESENKIIPTLKKKIDQYKDEKVGTVYIGGWKHYSSFYVLRFRDEGVGIEG